MIPKNVNNNNNNSNTNNNINNSNNTYHIINYNILVMPSLHPHSVHPTSPLFKQATRTCLTLLPHLSFLAHPLPRPLPLPLPTASGSAAPSTAL